MDKEKAKAFIFDATEGYYGRRPLYKSKDLQKLLDMSNGTLNFIYAIIDTESGETLMHMDWSYNGEPIIMHRFIHLAFFLDYRGGNEVIDLDK